LFQDIDFFTEKAQEEKSNPGAINLDRKLQNYFIYGHGNTKRFDTKQLTLTALTGMLKYMAKLKDLRVAHDKLGRLISARQVSRMTYS